MSRKLRAAVVGLGVGKGHAAAYRNLPDRFDLVAVCDLDPARRAAAEADWGVTAYDSLDAMIASGTVDIASVATPPNLHRAQVEALLGAGIHAVCEKPLTGSLADADALIEAEGRSKARIFPIFQYRWGNGFRKLLHLKEQGVFGTPFLSTIETSWQRNADYYDVPWRGKWATELGGSCLTQAIHAHDMLTMVMGPIASVYAHLSTRVNPIEVEDCAAISLGLANGSVATLSVTLGAAEELSRLRFMTSEWSAESRGFEPYRPGKDPWWIKGRTAASQGRIDAALASFRHEPEGYEGEFSAAWRTVVEGAPTPVTLEDARASLELITAIYWSAESGERVRLPIGRDHPRYAGWTPAARRFG